MYKSHIEIAKMFRHDPVTGEYFYHLRDSWVIGEGNQKNKETMKINEWVPVTKDVFDFLRRSAWAEFKAQERASRCRDSDGTRCMKDCKQCDKSRDGLQVSLDQMEGVELPSNDILSIEDRIEYKELINALYEAIGNLEDKDRTILTLWANGYSERHIACCVNMTQRSVNYRRRNSLKKLKELLKDF